MRRFRKLGLPFFYTIYLWACAPILGQKITSNDLWTALYGGRYLSWFHKFPHHSTFTFSPVRHFIRGNTYNWLGNLFFYSIYDWFSIYGLQVSKFLIIFGTILIMHAYFNYNTHPPILVTMIIFTLAVAQKSYLRNAIFALPGTATLFFIWHKFEASKNKLYLYIFPLLFLYWGNLHGSYLIGITLFLLLVVGVWCDYLLGIDPDTQNYLQKITIIVILCLTIVVFVKPFPDMLAIDRIEKAGKIIPFKSFGKLQSIDWLTQDKSLFSNDISSMFLQSLLLEDLFNNNLLPAREFNSPVNHLNVPFVQLCLLIGIVTLICLIFLTGVTFQLLLPLLGAYVLGLSSIRGLAYIPLVALPILLMQGKNYFSERQKWIFSNFSVNFVCLISIVLILVVVPYAVINDHGRAFTWNPLFEFGPGKASLYSDQVARQILKEKNNERVFNSLNTGAFLCWKWWPFKKVYIDGKSTAYSTGFLIYALKKPVPQQLDKYNFRYAILGLDNPWTLKYFRQSQKWKMLYSHDKMIVFEKVR